MHDVEDALDEIVLQKLRARHVDVHLQMRRGRDRLLPRRELPARLLHGPVAEAEDQARFLGHANELVGRYGAALRVHPAA